MMTSKTLIHLSFRRWVSFEVQSDHLVVRKLPRADDAYLQGVSRTFDEWNSPEDKAAWHHL